MSKLYGQKLQPGDKWKVGGTWVTWDGGKVTASCGTEYKPHHFEAFARRMEDDFCNCTLCLADGSYHCNVEAICIAQQIICEGLLP